MDPKYEELLIFSKKLFSKWQPEDFFSSKANHIYYYGSITNEKTQMFKDLFLNFNKTNELSSGTKEQPKPIVIHLNSPGGDVRGMNIMDSILFQARVPFCVVIEDLCASASTQLALIAPYRIIIDYSFYLIHDSSGLKFGKTSNSIAFDSFILDQAIRYKKLLKLRTKLTEEEIEECFQRDMLFNSKECLKKGIVDRILTFPKIKSYHIGKENKGNMSLPISTLLKKTNLNVISINNENIDSSFSEIISPLYNIGFMDVKNYETFVMALDSQVFHNPNPSQLKTIILQLLPDYLFTDVLRHPLKNIGILFRLALCQKNGIPLISYMEGIQNLSSLTYMLMCPNRISLTPSYISTLFAFRGNEFGWKFIDQIYNTNLMLNEIKRFFKTFSKLPEVFYKNLEKEIMNISPEDQLKYEINHKILDTRSIEINKKEILNYLKFNKITLGDLVNKERKNRIPEKIKNKK